MKFKEIAKPFNPAWFAAVMGTAVIPLVLSFLDFPFREDLGAFFFGVAVLMFLLILLPWSTKYLLYRESGGKDLSHPVAAHFLPTMPIAMIILAMDFLKYPDLFLSAEGSRALAFGLWLLGSLGIYLFGLPDHDPRLQPQGDHAGPRQFRLVHPSRLPVDHPGCRARTGRTVSPGDWS